MSNNYFYVKVIDTITQLMTGTPIIRKPDIERLEREQIHQIDRKGNLKFINLNCSYVSECYNKNVDKFLFEVKNIDINKGIVNIRYNYGNNNYKENWNINEICKKFYLYCPINCYLNSEYQGPNEMYLTYGEHGPVYKPLKSNGDVLSNFGEISSSPDHFEKPIAVQGGNALEGKTYGIYCPAVLNTNPIDIRCGGGTINGPITINNEGNLNSNFNHINSNQNEVSRLSKAISGGEKIQGHTIRGRVKEATITSRPVEHRAISAK